MIKKLIINFLILILLIIIAEFISFCILAFKYKDALYNTYKSGYSFKPYFLTKPFNPSTYDKNFRQPLISNTKKGEILIFGCSYAFGHKLSDKENFSWYLHKLTNRTIFNRSGCEMGAQMMLYQLMTKEQKNLCKNPDYILYVYIPDHLRRHLTFRTWPFTPNILIRYVLNKKDNLNIQILPHPLQYSNLFKIIETKFSNLYSKEYTQKLFFKIVQNSYIKSKELYPNSKFIILNYSKEKIPFEKEIENLGINIISISDLTDENIFSVKYQISEYDTHPNEKAWDLITPLLIKKAGIK